MKKILVIAIALSLAGCASCNRENEDFIPFPTNETAPKEQPRNKH